MPEVSCKAVAMQNSSQWLCSMCPIPQFRLVGDEDILYIFFSNISWTPWVLDPITNSYLVASWLHPISKPLRFFKARSNMIRFLFIKATMENRWSKQKWNQENQWGSNYKSSGKTWWWLGLGWWCQWKLRKADGLRV